MSYETYLEKISPPFIRGTWGRLYLNALGFMMDLVASAVKDAVKGRFVRLANVADLEAHGADLDLEKYPPESDEGYRSRLINAWDAWQWAGTAYGIETQLDAYGLAGEVKDQGNGWGFWNNPPVWAQIDVVFTHPHIYTSYPIVGAPLTVNGFIVGLTNMSSDEMNALRRLIRKWKSAHVLERYGVFATLGAPIIGDDLNIPYNVGGNGTVIQLWTTSE